MTLKEDDVIAYYDLSLSPAEDAITLKESELVCCPMADGVFEYSDGSCGITGLSVEDFRKLYRQMKNWDLRMYYY